MVSNICQSLIDEVWRSYANELHEVPEVAGIYAIGDAGETFLYVGHSKNVRRRLEEHKSGPQDIDQFVHQQFTANGGRNLGIKWVEHPNHKCVEGEYLDCIESKLGYWPQYNIQRGNYCDRKQWKSV